MSVIVTIWGKQITITNHQYHTAKIVTDSVADLLTSEVAGYALPQDKRYHELLTLTRQLVQGNGRFAEDEKWIAKENVADLYPDNLELIQDYLDLILPYIGRSAKLILEG